jgi:hypothetical protein
MATAPRARAGLLCPYRAWHILARLRPQGVALGCHVAAPLGRKTRRRNTKSVSEVFHDLFLAYASGSCRTVRVRSAQYLLRIHLRTLPMHSAS